MKIITTTNARKHIGTLVNRVKYSGQVYGIGRRNSVDAILIQFPSLYNRQLNDITNVNAYSKSFDFLTKEKDIYSIADLKKTYA